MSVGADIPTTQGAQNDKRPVLRVAYVHGRPCSHPNQQLLAHSLGGTFIPVDFWLRWQDRDVARWKRYLSWLVCSLTFPNVGEYDLFLAGGAHVTLPLMRRLGRLRADQKIVIHFGDEMLYSLHAGWLPPRVRKGMLRVISEYDALICEGTLQARLVREMLGERCPPVHVVINGIPNDQLKRMAAIQPNLESPRLLHIGAIGSDMRFRYKGLDTMFRAFAIAHAEEPSLRFTLVGSGLTDVIRPYWEKLAPKTREAMDFVPYTPELDKYVADSSLYFHCASGDAFPTTVLMAMAAGLPALVSEWTGARDGVRLADPRFVVEQDAEVIARALLAYHRMPLSEKQAVGRRMREEGALFGEDHLIARYRQVFEKLIEDFAMPRRLIPLRDAFAKPFVVKTS